jgi:ergothioneine biosynthesis protein EgtB
MTLKERYQLLRQRSEAICAGLKPEDYVVQPVVDVSPPKWHLGHTTWFFETFLLQAMVSDYAVFDPDYNYVFNSYYETIGARVIRTDRGNLSRPSVSEVMQYRAYVDAAMSEFLSDEKKITDEVRDIILLGFNHEEQHQELLITDIKFILGNNPLQPAYSDNYIKPTVKDIHNSSWVNIEEGVYEIGAEVDGTFRFDNEFNRHKVFLHAYSIMSELVTNEEFVEFIKDGGYNDFRHWHSDGWEWVKINHINAPMYWQEIEGVWYHYTPEGLSLVELRKPVCHISYYEAWAFASWKGMRLPTEAEWETASPKLNWGTRWEWTESAYLPYPGFKKAAGAIGEYNGKFMINQMVLRGASEATTPGHGRATYRNFFQPGLRWQFTGLRLARSL